MVDILRVDTLISGTGVQGGGIQQFYFDVGGGTAAQACLAAKNFWTTVAAQVGTGTTFSVQAAVPQVTAENGDIVVIQAGTAYTINGSSGGAVSPPEVQGLLRLRTGAYSDSREIRGRVFIPNVPAAAVASGAPHPDYLLALNTAGANLIADANSTILVYRRERQAAPQLGEPGQAGYRPAHDHRDGSIAAVTVASAWTKFAVLRSRRD